MHMYTVQEADATYCISPFSESAAGADVLV